MECKEAPWRGKGWGLEGLPKESPGRLRPGDMLRFPAVLSGALQVAQGRPGAARCALPAARLLRAGRKTRRRPARAGLCLCLSKMAATGRLLRTLLAGAVGPLGGARRGPGGGGSWRRSLCERACGADAPPEERESEDGAAMSCEEEPGAVAFWAEEEAGAARGPWGAPAGTGEALPSARGGHGVGKEGRSGRATTRPTLPRRRGFSGGGGRQGHASRSPPSRHREERGVLLPQPLAGPSRPPLEANAGRRRI